jgi:uncharacterized paraquat-inducible protein A
MKCPLCQVFSEKPELKRDPDDSNYAICPRCKTRVPNHDGKIKFRGRTPKKKEG